MANSKTVVIDSNVLILVELLQEAKALKNKLNDTILDIYGDGTTNNTRELNKQTQDAVAPLTSHIGGTLIDLVSIPGTLRPIQDNNIIRG